MTSVLVGTQRAKIGFYSSSELMYVQDDLVVGGVWLTENKKKAVAWETPGF